MHVGEDGNVTEEKISFKECLEKYAPQEPTIPDDLEDEDEEDGIAADAEEEMHSLDTHIGFEADSKYAKLVEDYMDKCDRLMGAIFRKKVISHAEMADYEARFKKNLLNFMKKMAALYPGLANFTTPMLKAITWWGVTLCRALIDTRRTIAPTQPAAARPRPSKKQKVEAK